MKIRVTMKTPDALDETIREVIRSKMASEIDDGRNANELLSNIDESILEQHIYEIGVLCQKWFRYGECLTVEIDTEAQTCVVVKHK